MPRRDHTPGAEAGFAANRALLGLGLGLERRGRTTAPRVPIEVRVALPLTPILGYALREREYGADAPHDNWLAVPIEVRVA